MERNLVLIATFAALFQLSCQQGVLDGLVKLIGEGETEMHSEPPDIENPLPEYDFVVVGAGTAGCVVANRLSENPNWNVLLIEAGRPENYLMDLPLLANYLQFTDANWKYKTVPSDRYCVGFDKGECNWPRGKVIGGSSVLNYMIYTRGNKRDYDHWANMGNTGWSFDDVLPYFKKTENFKVPTDHPEYHNTTGYLSVDYSPFESSLAKAIVEASKEFGLPYVDYNGPKQVGVSRLQLSMQDGTRHSSSRAYLHPIRDRPNLHVKKYSMVSKIIINPQTKQTEGVIYVLNNREYIVRVRKEVIVSAGAINSPQLLMLSGIGPKNHLNKFNIPIMSNLKVGFNLMDHIALGGLTFMTKDKLTMKTERALEANSLNQYFHSHKGPLTVPGGCEVLVFNELDKPNDLDGYPDIELLFIGGSFTSDKTLYKNFGITDTIYNQVYKPIEDLDSYMVFPMLLRPKSKGRIMLQSADYRKKPLIFPNYFADEQDMKTIVKGVQLTLNITEQPALKAMGAKLHNIPIPACKHFGFATDQYFDCMARHFTFTIYHQSGTCKMGPKSDRRAVVDPRLRVHGIKGLRVIDASIIPEIPAAHTNAPVFMIAEKGSDLIKEDWGFRQ